MSRSDVKGGALAHGAKCVGQIMDKLNPEIWVGLLNLRGELVYANEAALNALKLEPEAVLGRRFEETPWWAYSDIARAALRQAIRKALAGESSRFNVPVLDTGDNELILDFSLHPVFGQNGDVAYLVPSAQNVTEKRRAEHALHLTQFAVDHSPTPLLQVDSDACIRYANEAASGLIGVPRERLQGMRVFDFDIDIQRADWGTRWTALKAKGALEFESRIRTTDGSVIPVLVSPSFLVFEGKEFSFVSLEDISERKQAQERIRYLADYDGLTGLPNMRLLRDRLDAMLRLARQDDLALVVYFLGLERFRLVNETLGYEVGNELLKATAERLVNCVDGQDTVARAGGDEFIIACAPKLLRKEEVPHGAQRLMDAFELPFLIKGQEVYLGCSIGSAIFPRDGDRSSDLLKNAAIALRQAKVQGQSGFQAYQPNGKGPDTQRLTLETSLRKAHEREELSLHYQGRVDARTGRIVGAEALLRWHHPLYGDISPERFIPIGEETGLIVPVGEWALRNACVQMKVWADQGLSLGRLGINISPRQFRQHDLVEKVAAILAETGVAPSLVEFELTESLLMQDVESAAAILVELKKLGLRIALDDFGTGYSSLSYLKHFPIDTLKIDKAFLREINEDRTISAIVDAVLAMAKSLELEVIAEGVETQAQANGLLAKGCYLMQGFLYCRPESAESFVRGLRRRH